MESHTGEGKNPFSNLLQHRYRRRWAVGGDVDSKNPYSTYRDSRAHLSQWRHSIGWEDAYSIQELCREPMKKLGYRWLSSLLKTIKFRLKSLLFLLSSIFGDATELRDVSGIAGLDPAWSGNE